MRRTDLNDGHSSGAGVAVPALDADTLRAEWSRTYNAEGRPDWSHIFKYYDEGVVFRDSIQEVRGKEAFEGVCRRLSERCSTLSMLIRSVAASEGVLFFEWDMTMTFRKNPRATLHGATRLSLAESGLIVEQRDYYDLWGDIFDAIPAFGPRYRRFMRRRFG